MYSNMTILGVDKFDKLELLIRLDLIRVTNELGSSEQSFICVHLFSFKAVHVRFMFV